MSKYAKQTRANLKYEILNMEHPDFVRLMEAIRGPNHASGFSINNISTSFFSSDKRQNVTLDVYGNVGEFLSWFEKMF